MHSPSLRVTQPSAVVSLKPTPSLRLQVLGRLHPAGERARQVGAHRDLVPAGGLQVVHVVEGRDLVHGHRRHAEHVGHLLHHLVGQPAVLVLRDGERRHHRRLPLLRRVLGAPRARCAASESAESDAHRLALPVVDAARRRRSCGAGAPGRCRRRRRSCPSPGTRRPPPASSCSPRCRRARRSESFTIWCAVSGPPVGQQMKSPARIFRVSSP